MNGKDVTVSKADVFALIPSVTSDPAIESYIRETLETENYSTTVNGQPAYKIDLEGKFQGLGQFKKATWDVLMDEPFSLAGTVPLDLKAIVALYYDSKRVFLNHFPNGNFNNDIAYLYHNQGAGKARRILLGLTTMDAGQSKHAHVVARRAVASFS